MLSNGDGDDGVGGDDRRAFRHRGKHHKGPWPDPASASAAAVVDGAAARAVGRLQQHHHHRNGTAPAAAAGSQPPQHALHAGPPASMCYTTNEVLVIIAVTCFLNFAFVLLVMTCVHCFTDPSHHKKFGAVAYAELGDEQLFDADTVDGDVVTLLNPTKTWSDGGGGGGGGDCSWRGEYDPESCAPYQSLIAAHDRRPRRKCGRRSENDRLPFLFE